MLCFISQFFQGLGNKYTYIKMASVNCKLCSTAMLYSITDLYMYPHPALASTRHETIKAGVSKRC